MRRTLLRRFYFEPQTASDRGASSAVMSPKKPLFSRAVPIHMYANKEKALRMHTEDRFYGAKRMRDLGTRFWSDHAARAYFLTMIGAVTLGYYLLVEKQDRLRQQQGLIGPKRKPYKSRLTVVLDVDETIISYGDKAYRLRAAVVPRPFLAELLDYLTTIDAEVILWSASSERYMKQVVHAIDPTGVRISHYITRDPIWMTRDHFYEKNLRWLGRNLDDVVFIENRPMSIRNCNFNSILVDDFVRGEYMESGQDHPQNDKALHVVRQVVEDLETTGLPVPQYLASKRRNPEIKEIPCHLAMRQMPDELAVGTFYFVGNKFKAGAVGK